MKLVVFIFTILMSAKSFAKNDILEFYNEITSKCANGKTDFPEQLLQLNKKMKEHAKFLKNKPIESLFRDQSLFGDIYTYLGSEMISDDSDLRGVKACGKHYYNFLQSYKFKKFNESDTSFGEWELCLETDFQGVIPEIAKKVMSCYNARSPSNVKPAAKSAPKK